MGQQQTVQPTWNWSPRRRAEQNRTKKKNVFEEIKDEIFQKLILKQKQKLHWLTEPEKSANLCALEGSHYTCYNFTVYVN